MISRLQKFKVLAARQKLVLVQAWVLLGWYRAAILLLPFKRLTIGLRHHPLELKAPLLPAGLRDDAVMIGYLVAVASTATPWQSPCLAQVLVTQRLLAKRNIPGQFYLGVRRGCEFTDDPTGLSAHAWLQCGDEIVNGGAGHEQFTVVSAFSWGDDRSAAGSGL